MGKEYSMQEALKMAVQAEKDSMDFYRRAASVAKNDRARKVLSMLADEEAGHVRAFFSHYTGSDLGGVEEFLQSAPNARSAPYQALEKAITEDMHEKRALELALREEKATIDLYTTLAKDVIDPLVRGVFERVIKETQKHYELIEDEYMHIMTMVHSSDQGIYVRE